MEFDNLLFSSSSNSSNNADADVINGSQHSFNFKSNSQMLCFSSPSPFPFHNAGYGFGGMNWGFRGPFTPSQWMELEHQALIYKYFTANVPLPSYLLNPIKKALDSSGFSVLRPNALGWGAFQLGFSNTDPEPGRCRRTDGKKWRCSRDAVPDQKYCERHINRGRHRSRKPVEPQPGHSLTATVVVPDGGEPPRSHHQHTNGKTGIKKSVVDKKTAATGPYSSTFHSTASPDDQQSSFKESEFGLVCSDSLLNPLHRSLSLLNDSEPNSENVIRQFLEVYPKTHSLSWSDVDRTQLSISIPNASPTNENLPVSPLRLSRENEATRMGLNVGGEQNLRQNNWVPISWEPSIGGPLGEALECKNPEALNLIENWDHSQRAESIKVVDGAGFCNGLIGQGLMLPSLPALL